VAACIKGDLQSASDLAVALEVAQDSFHRAGVSKIEQMGSELREPSEGEARQIREYLDDSIESQIAQKFEDWIQLSEHGMAAWKPARVREPQGL
jgi:hypothetical protein